MFFYFIVCASCPLAVGVDLQDKNNQKPDNMAVNSEARAVLKDARCIVRESGVGDNASRVSCVCLCFFFFVLFTITMFDAEKKKQVVLFFLHCFKFVGSPCVCVCVVCFIFWFVEPSNRQANLVRWGKTKSI